MIEKTDAGIHWSFWLLAVFALIWNVLGSLSYLGQMNADLVATMPETHRAIIEGRPAWATGGFAVSVFAGALGGLLLLLRKSAAFYLFVASLFGAMVTMIHTIGVATSIIEFSTVEIVVMILAPLMVAALFIWYSKQAEGKGWIG
jgi:hypothetical protein